MSAPIEVYARIKGIQEQLDRLRSLVESQPQSAWVQYSVLGPTRLYSRRWDGVDGTGGTLRVGDRVLFVPVSDRIPIQRRDGRAEGIVVALGMGQLDYEGRCSTLWPVKVDH